MAATDVAMLDDLQRAAFDYFVANANPPNALVADTSRAGSHASIAVVGFALSVYPVAVERGCMTSAAAVQRSLTVQRFFSYSDPSGERGSTRCHGLYFHFVHVDSGKRAWRCELSMIDSAPLFAGMLTRHVLRPAERRRARASPTRGRPLPPRRLELGAARGRGRAWLEARKRVAELRLGGLRGRLPDQPERVRTRDSAGQRAILTGIGRLPAVQGLGLESAGVACDPAVGIQVNDFLRSTNPRIYAAGDVCLEHQFTNSAEASARIVVRNALLFGRQRLSALTIPWCTYTDPQEAHVGMYVKQAREQKVPVKTYTVPMHDVDRAIADGEEDGFVKIHVRDGTDRILGATIVGRSAGEMINVLSLAMVAGIGLRRLATVIHAYPTQGEAIRQAADACARQHASPLVAWLARKWQQ